MNKKQKKRKQKRRRQHSPTSPVEAHPGQSELVFTSDSPYGGVVPVLELDEALYIGRRVARLIRDSTPWPVPPTHGLNDWRTMGPVILSATARQMEAIAQLADERAWMAAAELSRSLVNNAITFAWLAVSPQRHLALVAKEEFLGLLKTEDRRARSGFPRSDKETRQQMKMRTVGVPGRLPSLAERARIADDYWVPRVHGLTAEIPLNNFTSWEALLSGMPLTDYPTALAVDTHLLEAEQDGAAWFAVVDTPLESDDPALISAAAYVMPLLAAVAAEQLGFPQRSAVRQAVMAHHPVEEEAKGTYIYAAVDEDGVARRVGASISEAFDWLSQQQEQEQPRLVRLHQAYAAWAEVLPIEVVEARATFDADVAYWQDRVRQVVEAGIQDSRVLFVVEEVSGAGHSSLDELALIEALRVFLSGLSFPERTKERFSWNKRGLSFELSVLVRKPELWARGRATDIVVDIARGRR